MSHNLEKQDQRTGIEPRRGEFRRESERLFEPVRSAAQNDWQQLREAIQRLRQRRAA